MKVVCPYCTSAVNDQSLSTHIHHVHHMILSMHTDSSPLSPPPSKHSCSSHASVSSDPYILNTFVSDICCPVPDCPAHSPDLYIMCRHICIRHLIYHFQVLGNYKFVQCPCCGIFLTSLTPEHFRSNFCIRQLVKRTQFQSSEQCSVTTETSTPFHIGANLIEYVSTFWYLGRILSEDDSDDMATYIHKEQAACTWGHFKALLRKDGASVETMGRFY